MEKDGEEERGRGGVKDGEERKERGRVREEAEEAQ